MLTFLVAYDCHNSALLRSDLQRWGLPRQGRPSAATSDGSVSKLISADSRLSNAKSKLLVHLGVKPLESHDQRFFFSTEPL
jgi:hypothetical protein